MNRIDPDTVAREIVEKWYKDNSVLLSRSARESLESAIVAPFSQYSEVLDTARNALASCAVRFGDTAFEALAEIDSILSRSDIPEVEEVEIERFIVFYADGSVSHVLTREGIQGFNCKGGTVKRVSHTIQRPKAKPVVMSVSGEVKWYQAGGCVYPSDTTDTIDWADLLGKTGHLTFTWTDPTK